MALNDLGRICAEAFVAQLLGPGLILGPRSSPPHTPPIQYSEGLQSLASSSHPASRALLKRAAAHALSPRRKMLGYSGECTWWHGVCSLPGAGLPELANLSVGLPFLPATPFPQQHCLEGRSKDSLLRRPQGSTNPLLTRLWQEQGKRCGLAEQEEPWEDRGYPLVRSSGKIGDTL